MEPQQKRRRLDLNSLPPALGLSTGVLSGESRAHMSSSFEGTGVSNSNGDFCVNGDLVVNHSVPPATTEPSHARLLLESLQFDQMDARHLSIKKAHANTCSWVLKTDSYKQWEEQGSSESKKFLWIKGKPGAGKSTLMKFLLSHKQSQIRKMRHIRLISFFFNARGNNLEKSIVGMYRSLLFQLLDRSPELYNLLNHVRPGHQWTVDSLKSLFEGSMHELEDTSVVCIIDALDECNEVEIRDSVRFLSGLIETGSRLSICFASRHYPHITVETGLSIILEDRHEHQQDIATYLSSALRIGQGPLVTQIHTALQEKACGVFMWVVLVVDILNGEYEDGRKHSLLEKLQKLPGDLHALFHRILTRDTKHRSGLLLCVQWILFAKRPLTPRQLYLAILSGSEPDHLAGCHSDDYSEDDVRKYILSNSKGLVESTKSKSPTIQFIHESVRDFLLKEDGLSKVFPNLGANIYGQSHEAIKSCCLKYMNMEALLKLKEYERENAVQMFPLLSYANHGVLYHADQAQEHDITQAGFLTDFPRSVWLRHYNILQKHNVRRYKGTLSATLLYILAEAGMPSLIRAHSLRQSCFEVEDERYGCPILAATVAKNNTTAEVMLELQAENIPEFSFSRFLDKLPLDFRVSYAPTRNFIYNKKRDLFPQLIQHGTELVSLFFLVTETCTIESRDKFGRTALTHAAEKGFNSLAKELLQLGADTSATAIIGMTPLYQASVTGNLAVAKSLLDYGADTSATFSRGWTPLHQASSYGHVELAKLLLDYGANISAMSYVERETPLHLAFSSGHRKMAELLLNYGADVAAVNIHGLTPRDIASRIGTIDVAEMLSNHRVL